MIEFGIKGLLFKLETYGTSGGLLDWFNSYLCNRTQNVMYKLRHFIIYFLNKSWCTPGFSFRTSAFLLYVNYVSENMLSFCRLFANDICIQYSSQNVSIIEHNINHDSLVSEQWSSRWLLKFNPSKTKAVFFTLKSSCELPEIFFNIVNSNTSRRTNNLVYT